MIDSKNYSILETERLLLREPSEDALADIVRNISDLEVSKWLAVVPYPYTEADGRWYLDHCKEKRSRQPRDAYNYWMQLKESGETIGGIGLTDVSEESRSAVIGYWIATAHHRRGYGSEVLKRILDFAFRDLELQSITASVFVGNPSSGKLLEKFGAVRSEKAELVHYCKATGKSHSIFEYLLTKQDYEKFGGVYEK